MTTTQTMPRSDRPAPGAHRAERPAPAFRVLRLRRALAQWVSGATTPASPSVLVVETVREDA